MSLEVNSYMTSISASIVNVFDIVDNLSSPKFNPLLQTARQRFIQTIGGTSIEPIEPIASSEDYIEYINRRSRSFRRTDERQLVIGDLYLAETNNAFFYVAMYLDQRSFYRIRRRQDEDIQCEIELGLIGEPSSLREFNQLRGFVSRRIKSKLKLDEVEWLPNRPISTQYQELQLDESNSFLSTAEISEDDYKNADVLEDSKLRDLSIVVKRAGGILASDLLKKITSNSDLTEESINYLKNTKLISQEFVIICRKSSNQVNRVDSMEKIEEMSLMGVKCSCGNPISEERIEELFIPTPSLQRLLDQSYWMTVRFVSILNDFDVPRDRILLNLHEGAEEIDAFVDLDGNLCMFELKDNEFSMGHAYPFGGRIGLYKPDTACIVTTSVVSPDVKQYFKRIEPDTEVVYIEGLPNLRSRLQQIIDEIRVKRAVNILSQFEPLANVDLPIANLLAKRIGIEVPKRTRKRR